MTTSAASVIEQAGGVLRALRDAQARPTIFPVTPEFTNWRSEQAAWRTSVALLDQSHHMTDLIISGPDAERLLRDTGVNNFENFSPNSAKQFVAVNHEGYLIGDAVLFHLEPGVYDLVGWYMVLDWVQFQGERGGYDVTFERDANSIMRETGAPPKFFRFEVQGPNALALVERVTGEPSPVAKFFGMARMTIAGVNVYALRHGMAGQPGFELFGAWADADKVLNALLDAGQEFGLVRVGAKAYSTANLESAWVPSPIPAIFTGKDTAEYLEWLPADRMGSLAGSLTVDDIEDLYLTPRDLGYDRSVAFNHDFIGREALEARREHDGRVKVTLVWNPEDVAAAQRTLYEDGTPAKYIEFPKARYGLYQMDAVRKDGEIVGISHDCGYLANEHAFVSLASVDERVSEPGTQVVITWGESPVSKKPAVEEHRQIEIRATVESAPYSRYARENYRS